MDKRTPIALGLILTAALTGCGEQAAEPTLDPTVTVDTTAAEVGSLGTDQTYIGTISAEGTASVVSLVGGNVERVAVSVGDTVSAGDLLCHFDDESAQIALQSAQANYQTALSSIPGAQAAVGSAQAAVGSAKDAYQGALAGYGGAEDGTLTVLEEQVRLAQDNYDDTKELLAIGAASQAEVDQAYQALISAKAGLEAAQANLKSAQSGVEQAQAGVTQAQAGVEQAQASVKAANAGIASAQYQLSLYNLTAPISGVVEAVNVTENNFAPSGTAAFVISNGSNKTVTFYVTDKVRQTMTAGQAATVSYGGRTYQGAVTEISGVVDSATGLFKIKAVIDGAADLPDGLNVELTTTAYRADRAVLVPSDALYFDNGDSYVYLVKDGKAVRTDVTVGLYTSDTIAVTDGLLAGDQVITSWTASLSDGAPVRTSAEAAEAGTTAAPETTEAQG
ncbi:efflux RND transporter periplasmic adaptor subunit [Pseudoflavonifractor sp. MSJ-37]|uniref:efflux RND transporter periplasmic adaptor subunit n=1 Tax=Pseudoflavonifractor sp. MSJ-37 TaxID=2841531 RepID=UPI001C114CF8|nr:efflux RND transporter periplasmic adaptor subunit [Pseudoflavonifractor sp. MSJ-37]MBU5434449.1 efflux RND transporter periplasmic adaptor subunit [Pseudoflavonifractor sp. MSJ-37]